MALEEFNYRLGSARPKIAGMNYEQASREGARLVEKAAKTGEWHSIVDDLLTLRELMKRNTPTPAGS